MSNKMLFLLKLNIHMQLLHYTFYCFVHASTTVSFVRLHTASSFVHASTTGSFVRVNTACTFVHVSTTGSFVRVKPPSSSG
jgi:hypothetical protein